MGPSVVKALAAAGALAAVRYRRLPSAGAGRRQPGFALGAARKRPRMLANGVAGWICGHGARRVQARKVRGLFEAVAAACGPAGRRWCAAEIALTERAGAIRGPFGAPPEVWHSEIPPARRRESCERWPRVRARVSSAPGSALFLPFPGPRPYRRREEQTPPSSRGRRRLQRPRHGVVRGRWAGSRVAGVGTPSLETVANAEADAIVAGHAGTPRNGRAAGHRRVDCGPTRRRAGAAVAAAGRGADEALAAAARRCVPQPPRLRAPDPVPGLGHACDLPDCSAWWSSTAAASARRAALPPLRPHGPIPKPARLNAEDRFVALRPGVERIAEEGSRPVHGRAPPSPPRHPGGRPRRGAVRRIEGTRSKSSRHPDRRKGYHFPLLTLVGVVDADLGFPAATCVPPCGPTRSSFRRPGGPDANRGRAGPVADLHARRPGVAALVAGDRERFLASRPRRGAPTHATVRTAGGVVLVGSRRIPARRGRPRPRRPRRGWTGARAGASPARGRCCARHRRRFLLKAPRGDARPANGPAWLDAVRIPIRPDCESTSTPTDSSERKPVTAPPAALPPVSSMLDARPAPKTMNVRRAFGVRGGRRRADFRGDGPGF